MSIPIDNFKLPAIITGFPNNYPEIRPMVVPDSLATITAAGYLNNSFLGGQAVSPFSLLPIIYNYTEGQSSYSMGWFQVSITSGIVTLFVQPALPGSTPWVNTVVETVAAPGTVRSITGKITDTVTTITSGNLVGVRGEVDVVGISGGYLYGVQGKVIPTGPVSNSGGGFEAGVLGQFDVSAATLGSTSYMAPVWSDFGATATSGTYAQAFLYSGTNSTAAILGAQINLYGGATSLMDLTDNNALVGATYFVASGTGSGSWGNGTPPTPSKVLKITVNGTAYYLPLVAQNS